MDELRDATGVWLPAVIREAEPSLMEWAAHRSVVGHSHLAPIAGVARLADGRLAVRFHTLAGLPLPAALDRIGALTSGVAVTLSLPLLDLGCVLAHGGVKVGGVRPDRVLIDDSGAPVLVDRPPATILPRTSSGSGVGPAGRAARKMRDEGHGATGATQTSADALPWGEPLAGVIVAVRVIWDRVDGRDPAREFVDAAITRARLNPGEEIAALMEAVRAAGPPRPVRWDLAAMVGQDLAGRSQPHTEISVVRVVRRLVDEGVPIGRGRRIGLRRAFVGATIAIGLVVASFIVTGSR